MVRSEGEEGFQVVWEEEEIGFPHQMMLRKKVGEAGLEVPQREGLGHRQDATALPPTKLREDRGCGLFGAVLPAAVSMCLWDGGERGCLREECARRTRVGRGRTALVQREAVRWRGAAGSDTHEPGVQRSGGSTVTQRNPKHRFEETHASQHRCSTAHSCQGLEAT